MQRRSGREAALPGETLEFEVSPGSSCGGSNLRWSGGGSPATGAGSRFATSFPTGGTFVVTARCGEVTAEFPVTVCEVDAWLSRATSFYGPSVDLSKVTVKTSRLVMGPPGTAWTCNDVIRFKRPARALDLPSEATLIHELAHVWEHQTGQAQLLKGIVEQIGRRFGRNPYDFGGPEGARRADSLTAFTKEGQAQVVTELWKSQHGHQNDAKGVAFSTPGYREDLRRLVEGAGIGTRPPTGRTIAGSIDSLFARLVNGIVDLVA